MSLNEEIGKAMGKAAHGAVLGHAIGKLRDEAEEASDRAMSAEAHNEELKAILRKQGISIPGAPSIQRNPKGQIYLTLGQFKFLFITVVLLVIGGTATIYIYDYLKNIPKENVEKKRDKLLSRWGAGYWQTKEICQQYGRVAVLHLGLDANFDEDGNVEPPRPTGVTYDIYFQGGKVANTVRASGPLGEDGRFSIQQFGGSPITGIFDFKTKRHEVKIPGCPLMKPTIDTTMVKN